MKEIQDLGKKFKIIQVLAKKPRRQALGAAAAVLFMK